MNAIGLRKSSYLTYRIAALGLGRRRVRGSGCGRSAGGRRRAGLGRGSNLQNRIACAKKGQSTLVTVSKRRSNITGVKAFALGFGRNDDACAFSCFAASVFGDIGVACGLRVAAAAAVLRLSGAGFAPLDPWRAGGAAPGAAFVAEPALPPRKGGID